MTVYDYTAVSGGSSIVASDILDGTFLPSKLGEVDPSQGPFVLITADANSDWEINPPYDNLYGLSLSASQPGSSSATQNGVEYYFRAYDVAATGAAIINKEAAVFYRKDTQSE